MEVSCVCCVFLVCAICCCPVHLETSFRHRWRWWLCKKLSPNQQNGKHVDTRHHNILPDKLVRRWGSVSGVLGFLNWVKDKLWDKSLLLPLVTNISIVRNCRYEFGSLPCHSNGTIEHLGLVTWCNAYTVLWHSIHLLLSCIPTNINCEK